MAMEKQRLGAWAASSADPTEVSNRVKGAVLALSSVIIYLAAQLFGIVLSASDIVALSAVLGTLAGATWGVWGALIALVRFIATVRN